MPNIPYADIDALPPKAREAYDRLPRKLNIFRMWANTPELFVSGLRFAGHILSREKLDARSRELLILLAAKLDGGAYEWFQHVPIAENVGCPKAQIEALDAERLNDPSFDAREKALLRFAKEVIRNVKASKESLDAALVYFSSQEIVEIILTCGFYMALARLTETTGVEIDEAGGLNVVKQLSKPR